MTLHFERRINCVETKNGNLTKSLNSPRILVLMYAIPSVSAKSSGNPDLVCVGGVTVISGISGLVTPSSSPPSSIDSSLRDEFLSMPFGLVQSIGMLTFMYVGFDRHFLGK